MTLRYDIINAIGDHHKENSIENPTFRTISIAVAEDTQIKDLWVEKYGKTLPHSLSNRKKSLLMRDVRKEIEGESVQGDSNGIGHRSPETVEEVNLVAI